MSRLAHALYVPRTESQDSTGRRTVKLGSPQAEPCDGVFYPEGAELDESMCRALGLDVKNGVASLKADKGPVEDKAVKASANKSGGKP